MISVRSSLFVSAGFAIDMTIDKITVINNCDHDVYFAHSVPSNAKISPNEQWSQDWKIGNGNIVGRLSFSYSPTAFANGGSGSNSPLDMVWLELATKTGNVTPGVSTPIGG